MSINKHLKDTSTFKASNSKQSKDASVLKKENIQHMGNADASRKGVLKKSWFDSGRHLTS